MGTLYTEKLAHLYGKATGSLYLLCHQPESQIHVLFGYENTSIQNTVAKRLDLASRLIIKSLSKDDFG